MLKPDEDRLYYGNLLQPPEGYECEFAVGTTYSLDLETLVGVPLALFLHDEMDGALLDNPVAVLEGIRKSADRFVLFCEGGQVKVPRKFNPLFSLLERNVFEVNLRNGKSFHPKVWIIKYVTPDTDDVLYRCIVMSRNATFDRSWDLAASLEGRRSEQPAAKNAPLRDFLAFLRRFAADSAMRRRIDRLAEELAFVRFETGNRMFTDFDFVPIGIGPQYDKASTGLFETWHHLLIITPFLSRETIMEFERLGLSNARRTLITRRSEIPKLTADLLERFETYCLKDIILDGEEALSERNHPGEEPQRQDIHAKLYARSKNTGHSLYIGSANCSRNAFHGNVEFMLRLRIQKYGFRISQLLDELFGKEGDLEDDRRNPFERVTALPVLSEPADDTEDALQKAIKALCRSSPKAVVHERNGAYIVEITVNESYLPRNIDLTLASLGGGEAVRVAGTTVLKGLRLKQLGEFYVATATKGETTVQRIVKIRTRGIPETRDRGIVSSVVRDETTFLQYVAFLLADDYLLSLLEQGENGAARGEHGPFRAWDMPVLYEQMLKAASRSPHKLNDIEDLLKLLSGGEDGIVPPEFEALYRTFRNTLDGKVKA